MGRKLKRYCGIAFAVLGGVLFNGSPASQEIYIRVQGNAHFILIDTLGRRSGLEPVRIIDFDEIPTAFYEDQTFADDSDTTGETAFRGSSLSFPNSQGGTFQTRVYGDWVGPSEIWFILPQGGDVRDKEFLFTGTTTRGSVALYRVQYEPTGSSAVVAVRDTPQVKAGVFAPNGAELRLACRSTLSRTPGSDTLQYGVVTLRWPESASVDLSGAVTGAYGFRQAGPVMTVSGYRYQRFCTTAKVPLSWTAGMEYELLRVPVVNPSGTDIELSSAILGSEWSLQIGAEECADTVSYHPVATGLPRRGD